MKAVYILAVVLVVGIGFQSLALTEHKPYDETASGQQQVADALVQAQAENKHVLIVWGANWCSWCRGMDEMMRKDSAIQSLLDKNYVFVKIDMGERTKNMDLARKYDADIAIEEIPHWTFLDATGKVLGQRRSGELGPGEGHYETLKFAQALEAHRPGVQIAEEGYTSLFNGKDLTGWVGDIAGYTASDGVLVCKPGGNLFTAGEYADFSFRFEFKLPPGGNNGVGIRAPVKGDGAYAGMEIQILDDRDPQYREIFPYQAHGSVYGIVPAKRDHLKPVGEWNEEEIIAKGRHITVILNGVTIVDADLDEATKNGAMDGKEHPGVKNATGHIGFLGHGSIVEFRNIRIKKLD